MNEQDICDCQDPLCDYGGIEHLLIENSDKHNYSRKLNRCELCGKSPLVSYSKAPTYMCSSCAKGLANFKFNLNNLYNALSYLCKTIETKIYSYSFGPKEKSRIYKDLLHKQGGRCAICNIWWKDIKNERKMHTDHSHITGYIRGLLCINCNMALGYFKDSTEAIANAINNLDELMPYQD